jgi:prepilin-type N-terminal cleavage/methylation domain-containing protein
MLTKETQRDNTKLPTSSQDGFTLIELLVVISIIALLSSIILAALSSAKINAGNAARLELVHQYAIALENYRDDHNGLYPNNGYANTVVCVGANSSCFVNSGSYSNTINAALAQYIPGPPADTISVPTANGDFRGIMYSDSCSSGPCSGYTLWYWLYDEPISDCLGATNSLSSVYLNTAECTYSGS